MLNSMIRARRRRALALVALWAAISPAVQAQEPSIPPVETRVFDIRSLLLDVPNYRAIFSDLRSDDLYRPLGTRQGGGQGPGETPASAPIDCFPAPGKPTPKNEASIMGLIQNIVQPDTWRSNGGEPGSMEFYAGQLVVRQTKPAIDEVEQLLNLIRAARVRKVNLEAWFVVVPSKAAERAALAPALDRTEFTREEFLKGMETKPDAVAIIRVSLSGFDGQRVYASSGRQFNVTVGLQPVIDSSAVSYQPQPRQLLSGVSLEAQPVAEPDRGLVLLDLRASLGKMEPPPARPPQEQRGPEFELTTPPYQVAHFATSVSLPVGKVSRVGMTRYDENQDVLLFVMPSVE